MRDNLFYRFKSEVSKALEQFEEKEDVFIKEVKIFQKSSFCSSNQELALHSRYFIPKRRFTQFTDPQVVSILCVSIFFS